MPVYQLLTSCTTRLTSFGYILHGSRNDIFFSVAGLAASVALVLLASGVVFVVRELALTGKSNE
eukprot:6383506-Amphidinium_carterae.2